MPTHIPFEALQAFCEANGLIQACLMAWDGQRTHVVTWGADASQSDMAAEGGNLMKRTMGWDESYCNTKSAKVAKLEEEIEELKEEIAWRDEDINEYRKGGEL